MNRVVSYIANQEPAAEHLKNNKQLPPPPLLYSRREITNKP